MRVALAQILGTDDPSANLEIVADHQSDFYQWFHFRVAGARGRTLTIRILNAGGAAYAFGWPGYRATPLRRLDGFARLAGLGVAFRAKPLVKQSAKQAISTLGLDGILYLLGFRDREGSE